MMFRNSFFFLSVLLFLSGVKATDKLDDWILVEDQRPPVTARMWFNPDGTGKDEHISVQTPKHYMSFRPVSEEPIIDEDKLEWNPSFACLDYESDQSIQNRKLNGGMHTGNCEGQKTWPCLTLIIEGLDATAIDNMWEGLLKDASSTNQGMVFKNVHYVTEDMRIRFQKFIENSSESPRESTQTFYFTNTSMAYGLLCTGNMLNKDVYYLESPKYFKSELYVPPFTHVSLCYQRGTRKNFYTRADNPSIQTIYIALQNYVMRRELIRIHQSIELYGLSTLSLDQQKKIVAMLGTDETLKEKRVKIDTYLTELGRTWKDTIAYYVSKK
jgi:hypothetical protein